MTQNKLTRLKKQTDISRNPATFEAILNSIAPEIKETVNSKQLAKIVDLAFSQHCRGEAQGFEAAKETYDIAGLDENCNVISGYKKHVRN